MKHFELGRSGVTVPSVCLGLMRIGGMAPGDLDALLKASMDEGLNFFDHADIYGGGRCEEVFAESCKRLGFRRDQLLLQSKCGIRNGFFDFSKAHILDSVERILARLQTDYLDFLLLHRPDTLMEPAEVAEAFATLRERGQVRFFGVSNFNPGQIRLLQSALPEPLHVNQLQFSLAHTGMIDQGLTVNMRHDNGLDRDGGVLEYCRLERISIQAWSPFQYGFFEGVFLDSPKYVELNTLMDEICAREGITKTGLAISWIQRHPAGIQSVVGTTQPSRVREVVHACGYELSREEWYALYRAAGNILP